MEKNCQDCIYFRHHFVKRKKGYYQLTIGHCQYPRLKMKKQEQIACEFFKQVKGGA